MTTDQQLLEETLEQFPIRSRVRTGTGREGHVIGVKITTRGVFVTVLFSRGGPFDYQPRNLRKI